MRRYYHHAVMGTCATQAILTCRDHSSRPDPQCHSDFFLQYLKDCEEVCRIGITSRTQHPMQTLAWLMHRSRQLLESDRRIDDIPEDGFARSLVSAEVSVDCLGEECLPERRVALSAPVNGCPKLITIL